MQKGFTIIEVLVFVAIFAVAFTAIAGLGFWLDYSNKKLKADSQALENSRNALDAIIYEIKNAQGVYTPTTTENQLSLEVHNNLPAGETSGFLDFYLCGQRICLKRDSQNPAYLTPESVQVQSLQFIRISAGGSESIKAVLTASSGDSFVELSSSASLRSY